MMGMAGIGMMLKSMGLDPAAITAQVGSVISDVEQVQREMERQGRLLDAIAAKLEINPRAFDAPTLKEIDHE